MRQCDLLDRQSGMHDARHASGALCHGDRLIVQCLRRDVAGQKYRRAVNFDIDACGIGAESVIERRTYVIRLQHVAIGNHGNLHGGGARAGGVNRHRASGARGQGSNGEQTGGNEFDMHGSTLAVRNGECYGALQTDRQAKVIYREDLSEGFS